MDASVFFQYDEREHRTIFVGDKCTLYFPKRYEAHDLLTHTDTVHVLGICDAVINDTHHGGILLAAMINIIPSEAYTATIDDEPYLVVVLHKGDTFMASNDVIRNDKFIYLIWNEFIALGRMPKFINDRNIHRLFDIIGMVTGVRFDVDHAVFEMVYSHIFRDPDDITIKYRHTKREKSPYIVPLRSIAYGPDTTIDKIVGSYSNDGINSALVNKSDLTSDIEIQLSS